MLRTKKQELTIFVIIVGVAVFFRFYQFDISKIFSATWGIFTIIGLYLLVRGMFEWRLAAIASYLMAISFWHVNFSRMESVAIMIPFVLVYSSYFLWRGLRHNHIPDFVIAGIFGGLGFYTSISYYAAPFIFLLLFLNYWWYLKKDFDHAKYEHAKTRLLQGFVIFALTAFTVALPMGIYLWQYQREFALLTPMSGVGENILASNIVKTLGMFNFSDSPILPWPIGVFFVIGFINEIIHWLKRKHGHFSTVHTFMFVWFWVMLIPGFLSSNAPDVSLTIGALPMIILFTARGIWWFFEKLSGWYKINDPHSVHESHAITALAMIVFLFSIGFIEYWRYFQ